MVETLGHVIDGAIDMARRDRWMILATLVLGTVPTAYASTTMDAMDAFRFSALWGIVLYLPMVIVTQRALVARGAIQPEARGRSLLPRAIGQGLLYQLGVLAGLVLLIIPGLVLMTRWLVVLPVLVSRNCSVTESFSISWALTGRNIWLVASVLAFAILLFLAGLLPTAIFGDTSNAVIAEEALITAGQIASWLLSISLFLSLTELDRAGATAEDIFA